MLYDIVIHRIKHMVLFGLIGLWVCNFQ